jgi:hypothetical protein
VDDVVKGLILVGLFLTALFGLFHWGEDSLQKARMPSLYPSATQANISPGRSTPAPAGFGQPPSATMLPPPGSQSTPASRNSYGTPAASNPLTAEDYRQLAEVNRLAALNRQRLALSQRINALLAEANSAYRDECQYPMTESEEYLAEASGRATPHARRMAIYRQLAACYRQMAALYQQDDPGGAAWFLQAAQRFESGWTP